MPLYEYYCPACQRTFEALRPMSDADRPMTCPHCASADARKMISVFAAVSKDGSGTSRMIASSSSGCASCSGGSCSTCGH